MSEENEGAEKGTEQEQSGKSEAKSTGGSFTPITSSEALQAAIDKAVAPRLERERAKFADYDDLRTKASEYDKLEDAKKTELERAAEAREAEKVRADKAEATLLRLEVASDKGLTAAQARRLVGATKADLEKDADDLIASFPTKPEKAAAKASTALRSGATGTKDDGVTGKGRAAAALRELRRSGT